jgi:hypothetical protein
MSPPPMRETVCVLNLKYRLLKAVLSRTDRQTQFKMAITVLFLALLVWFGIDNLLINLHRGFSPEAAVQIVQWLLSLVASSFLVGGTLHAIEQLYTEPENGFLLSMPIGLHHFFVVRWIERLVLNLPFALVAIAVLIQEARYVSLGWPAFVWPVFILILLQQLQFLLAILISRRIGGLVNGLGLLFTIALIALSLVSLGKTSLISVSTGDLAYVAGIGAALVVAHFLIQRLFVVSFFHHPEKRQTSTSSSTYSLHRLLVADWPGFLGDRVRALVAKDMILFLRRVPILHLLLSVLAILLLTMIAVAAGGANVAIISGAVGGFIVFAWVLHVFEFEKRQTQQLWLLKTAPVSGGQILGARFCFICVLACLNGIVLSLAGMVASRDPMSILILPTSLVLLSVVLALLATGILFSTWPYFRLGEYLFVIICAVAIALGSAMPPLGLVVVLLAVAFLRRGMGRLEAMEI